MIRGGVQVCRMITIITNTAAESLSSFTVALTSSNSAVSEPFTTVVAILDDDGITLYEILCQMQLHNCILPTCTV